MATNVIKTACQGCMEECGALVHVKDGKVTKIEVNPEDPKTEGVLGCYKGKTYTELLYHPDRILYPLKRIGERGQGKWERITWDQALSEIGAKLNDIIKQYGPETIGFGWGTYPKGGVLASLLFLKSIKSPQAFTLDSHYCFTPHVMACTFTYGETVKCEQIGTYFKDTKCVVLWGFNPKASFPTKARRILKRQADGLKLIVIDPRRNQLAAKADMWLRVKPATDDALALGWLNVIIKEGLYDKSFVENWTTAPFLIRSDTNKSLRESDIKDDGSSKNFVVWDSSSNAPVIYDSSTTGYKTSNIKPAITGSYKVSLASGGEIECETVWQRLAAEVEEYTPERVEEITWVPKEEIIEAARTYATSKPAVLMTHMGIAMNHNSIQTSRALSLLIAITGNLDVSEGNVFARFPAMGYMEYRKEIRCSPEVEKKVIGAEDFPLLSGPDSSRAKPHPPLNFKLIEQGKGIKAFWTSSNVVVNIEDSLRAVKALKKLELFVVVDFFMTPTADLADYVLPPATWLEREGIASALNHPNYILARQKVVEPLGEARNEYHVIFDLLKKMEIEPAIPVRNYEELLDYRLKRTKTTFEEFKKRYIIYEPIVEKKYEKGLLRQDGNPGFKTPSGKCEIWSTTLEDYGYEPLPYYKDKYPSQEIMNDYPLILTDGRHLAIYHGQGLNLPSRRKMVPDPTLEIHPETAKNLSLNADDWVWIETYQNTERCKRKVKLAPELHPKVVFGHSHYFYPEKTILRERLEPVINLVHTMEPPYDPIVGATYIRGVPCRVYRA
jgi:anaerobic selenocysteine-containing dehydrogenase